MALNTGKILMRRGQEANFDPNKMMPGEWAVSLDSKYVRMCFSPGVCIRMATYEAFEADMEQIRGILAECQTVEEAVQRIYEDIKDVAVDVERIETAAANALKSEQNALNSANSASQSANTATQKASEAVGSANIASTKAEQATEGANTATQKASEAAESAGNVRNMSEVSESYAVGGTGTREGEDTDNAKYYNQQASDNADRAEAAAERASAVADVGVATTEKAGLVKPDGETIRVDSDGTIHADRGTTSYTDLENKPKINDVELDGDKTLDELGIASKDALEETDNKVNIIIENAELRFKETASGENIHLDDSADSKLVEFGLYGKAVQNGTPAPQNPVDIEVAGSGGSVEVKSFGKNLIPYPFYETESKTINGITFTENKDGTITANGTATANATFIFSHRTDGKMVLSAGSYRVSGCPSGGSNGRYRLVVAKTSDAGENENVVIDIGAGGIFTLSEETDIYVGFDVISGKTVSNLLVKPMIRISSAEWTDDATWEPFKEITSIISTPNGLAGIPVDSGGNYTDKNRQQWICDEIVKCVDGSGEYVKRVESVVFDGSEDEGWANASASDMYRKTTSIVANSIKMTSNNNEVANILCTQFVKKNINQTYQKIDGVSVGTNGNLYFYSSEYNTNNLSAWKTYLSENPMECLYELAKPVITPLTQEQLAGIEKLKTFYPTTNISNNFDCGMKVKYIVDSKNYIDNKLALQAKAREEEMMSMLLLLPEETQAKMIENDTNNLLTESEE